MILNYNKFLNEYKLLEGLREMKLILSDNFLNILNKIDHPISDAFLNLHNDLDFKSRQTFVDIHPNNNNLLTFILANKASELLNIDTEEKYNDFNKYELFDIDLDDDVYNRYRSEIRIGVFINNLFGTRFQSSLEEFIRLYKVKYKKDPFELMEIVKGDKIAYFYNCNNYESNRGSLGNSCMSDVDSSFFDIYVENDNIGLLVLYDDNKEYIRARALVWFDLVQPEGRTFMDRIYTIDSSDEQLFIEYAKKNKWIYKNNSWGRDFIDSEDGTRSISVLKSQLNPTSYDYYPYLDTMLYYNPKTGLISNSNSNMKYILQSTSGEVDILDEYDDYVWSEYHGEDIRERYAKYCYFGDDWVLEDEAIKVYNTDGKYAVPGHSSIVKSEIPGITVKHFEKNKCIWSEYLNTWVFKSSARIVWVDLDKSNSVIDHKSRENIEFFKINNEYWYKDLVEKNENNEWVLKK